MCRCAASWCCSSGASPIALGANLSGTGQSRGDVLCFLLFHDIDFDLLDFCGFLFFCILDHFFLMSWSFKQSVTNLLPFGPSQTLGRDAISLFLVVEEELTNCFLRPHD